MLRVALLIIAFAVLMFLLAVAPAFAATCAPRAVVLERFLETHGEEPNAVGLTLGERPMLMELLVSESGSWTMIVTTREGIACIVSAGENFEWIDVPKGQPI